MLHIPLALTLEDMSVTEACMLILVSCFGVGYAVVMVVNAIKGKPQDPVVGNLIGQLLSNQSDIQKTMVGMAKEMIPPTLANKILEGAGRVADAAGTVQSTLQPAAPAVPAAPGTVTATVTATPGAAPAVN